MKFCFENNYVLAEIHFLNAYSVAVSDLSEGCREKLCALLSHRHSFHKQCNCIYPQQDMLLKF